MTAFPLNPNLNLNPFAAEPGAGEITIKIKTDGRLCIAMTTRFLNSPTLSS